MEWASITPISILFLLHIFTIESWQSGFVDYERIFLVVVTGISLVPLLISLIRKKQVYLSTSNLLILFIIGYLLYQGTIGSTISSNEVGDYLYIPILYFVLKTCLSAHAERLILCYMWGMLMVAIFYMADIHPMKSLAPMNLNYPINTGLNATLFASVAPFALAFFIHARSKSLPKLYYRVSIALFCACVAIVSGSHARTSNVAGLLAIIVVIYQTCLSNRWRYRLKNKWSLICFLIFLVAGGYLLYAINPGSVQGRVLIYWNAFRIFLDHPFFGVGTNGFPSIYNHYQASYFADHTAPINVQLLASDIYQPFNEYLRALVELGLIGTGFLVICIYRLVKCISIPLSGLQIGAAAAILSLMISGTFSYPLSARANVVNLIFFTVILTNGVKNRIFHFYVKAISSTLVTSMILLGTTLAWAMEYRVFIASRNWEKATLASMEGKVAQANRLYKAAYPPLYWNGRFLLNYGAELIISGSTDRGIVLLERARTKLPVTTLYLYLGDAYLEQKYFERARDCYQMAINITPNRFTGRYKLLQLQLITGDLKGARITAKTILDYPVKIPSETVEEIKSFARSVLFNTSNGNPMRH